MQPPNFSAVIETLALDFHDRDLDPALVLNRIGGAIAARLAALAQAR